MTMFLERRALGRCGEISGVNVMTVHIGYCLASYFFDVSSEQMEKMLTIAFIIMSK